MTETTAQLPLRGPNREFPIPVEVIKEGLTHTTSEWDPVPREWVAVFDVLEETLAPVAGEGAMPWPKVIAVPRKRYYRILKKTRLLHSTKAYLYNVDFLIDDFPTEDQNEDQNKDTTSWRDKLIKDGLGDLLKHSWSVRFSQPEDVHQWAQENANTNGHPCRKVIFTTIERVSKTEAWRQGITQLPEAFKRGVILPSWVAGRKDDIGREGTYEGNPIDVEEYDRLRLGGIEGNPITLV